MKLSLFNISDFRVDGGAMFGVVPKALWSRQAAADENNNIVLSLNSLVIKTDGHLILVDAGWGNKQNEKFFRHVYLHGGRGLEGGLADCGYHPEEITDVIITHMHADHCGGCFRNSPEGNAVPVFKNATYHISKEQWEWANDSNPREEDSFLPENIRPFGESGRLNLIKENGELFRDVEVKIFYGHTPGLMLPLIKYLGRTIFYAGDLIPTTAHIPLLWNMSYDLLPLMTIAEKEEILEKAFQDEYIIFFQHDPHTECCTLTQTPKGIRAGVKGKLTDFTKPI